MKQFLHLPGQNLGWGPSEEGAGSRGEDAEERRLGRRLRLENHLTQARQRDPHPDGQVSSNGHWSFLTLTKSDCFRQSLGV